MLINKTKEEVIVAKVKIAKKLWERLKGLMFENVGSFNYALILELPKETKKGAAIHSMFVFFPFDVVWLDSKRRVVDKKSNIKPFTATPIVPKKKAKYIVELPAGKAKSIRAGDLLEWK
ncbi:MAG: DUF192 domain-containing protein [Candidatus Diapherotrites archaeon]|nr:DUF192 domain-containing protein [Candidatus Diapherotrites archaeon]